MKKLFYLFLVAMVQLFFMAVYGAIIGSLVYGLFCIFGYNSWKVFAQCVAYSGVLVFLIINNVIKTK